MRRSLTEGVYLMTERANLTECERIVMKSVWDAGKDVSLVEIMAAIRDRYGRNWKRQTVSTFLLHLIQKGYLTSYRVGRVFYYHQEVELEAYKQKVTAEFLDFWYDNSLEAFEEAVKKQNM